MKFWRKRIDSWIKRIRRWQTKRYWKRKRQLSWGALVGLKYLREEGELYPKFVSYQSFGVERLEQLWVCTQGQVMGTRSGLELTHRRKLAKIQARPVSRRLHGVERWFPFYMIPMGRLYLVNILAALSLIWVLLLVISL